MIAGPDSFPTPRPTPQATSVIGDGPLSASELYQLTLYKWRYSLEAYGFERDAVRRLMFVKWLHATRRVVS